MSNTNITISTEPVVLDVKEFTNNVEIDTNTYTVNGEGIFDILMMTATKHLIAQYKANRIRQEDYANAYIDIYKYTLQAALEAWLRKGTIKTEIERTKAEIEKIKAETLIVPLQGDKIKADIDYSKAQTEESKEKLKLLAKQLELLTKQLEAEDAKKDLYKRQIEGFDEEYKYKILKILMDSWAVGFSVAKDSFEAQGIPAPMQKATIDDLYNKYVVKDLDV